MWNPSWVSESLPADGQWHQSSPWNCTFILSFIWTPCKEQICLEMDPMEEWSQPLSGGKFLPAPNSLGRYKQRGQDVTGHLQLSWQSPPALAWMFKPRKSMQVYANFSFKSGDWLIFGFVLFFFPFFVLSFFLSAKAEYCTFPTQTHKTSKPALLQRFNSVSNLTSSLIWSFEGTLNTLHSLGMPSVWPLYSMQCKTD